MNDSALTCLLGTAIRDATSNGYPPKEWVRDHYRSAGYVTCVEDIRNNLIQYLRQQHKKTPTQLPGQGKFPQRVSVHCGRRLILKRRDALERDAAVFVLEAWKVRVALTSPCHVLQGFDVFQITIFVTLLNVPCWAFAEH